MIRPIDIKLNAAHPELPLVEATTFTGAPSSVFIRGVPKNCGNWSITAVNVAVTYPDNSTTTRAAVESAEGVWVATIPGTATSGRTAAGFRILADGIDENGAPVTGYVLGFADFSVLSFTPVPAPGGTFYLLRYFDQAPATPKEGDVAVVDGLLKMYNGTAWAGFGDGPGFSTDNPQMDGSASPGSAATAARSDHVHPTDTSRVPTTRTVNGKALSSDVTIGDEDIPYTGAGSLTFPTVGAALNACSLFVSNLPSYSDILYLDASSNICKNGSTIYETLNIGYHPIALLQSNSFDENYLLMFDSSGNVASAGVAVGNIALKSNLPYNLVTKTISNNTVALDDRAINAVAVSSALASLTVNFPTATSGKVRDFGLRLTVASGITTAPQLVLPQGVTCENADGTPPEIGADGAATILYFTETAANVFLVKGEVVQTISNS